MTTAQIIALVVVFGLPLFLLVSGGGFKEQPRTTEFYRRNFSADELREMGRDPITGREAKP